MQRNIGDKSQFSYSASTIFISEKRKTRINVAKSILGNCDRKNFRNHARNCAIYEHKEDHCKMNPKQYQILKTPKMDRTIFSREQSSVTSHTCNRDELFTVLKHAFSLDQSLDTNIYDQDMNAVNKNINHKNISRNCTFLRKKKLSKLDYLQFNHLIYQIFH